MTSAAGARCLIWREALDILQHLAACPTIFGPPKPGSVPKKGQARGKKKREKETERGKKKGEVHGKKQYRKRKEKKKVWSTLLNRPDKQRDDRTGRRGDWAHLHPHTLRLTEEHREHRTM